jgi:dTDP-4-amino-4,6-dideoxygalactose transaminase
MERRVVFGQPWIGEEEIELVVQTLRSGWIGQGPLVERFERDLAAYVGASEVVAVSSCTAALHLALLAAGIGPGDEVITTPLTFVATANAIQHAGATPVLVDIDPVRLLLTPEHVERAITPRTRAVVPVSFGGRPLDLTGFCALADAHDLWLVEDAAHSVGAIVDGAHVGADRHPRLLTCFSFYPNKNLASAEGGAICLDDSSLATRLRSMRLHGLEADAWQRYRVSTFQPSLAVEDGYKSNWTDLQAAIAVHQLTRLEGFLSVRQFLAETYDDLLVSLPDVARVPWERPSLRSRHALHLYQVRVAAELRNEAIHRMRQAGAGAALHYIAVHHHPRYAHLSLHPLPAADAASGELVSLPLHPGMHVDDVAFVVDQLGAALSL